MLVELAKRLNGHPHFGVGHCQPMLDRNGEQVGWFDLLPSTYPEYEQYDFSNVGDIDPQNNLGYNCVQDYTIKAGSHE